MTTKKKKYTRRKSFTPIIVCVSVVIMAMALATGVFLKEYNRTSTEGKKVIVVIPEGATTRELISLLHEKGIIRFQLPFYMKLINSPYWGKLRHGRYELNDGMSLDELVEVLGTGAVMADNMILTIPEGYTVEMIAEKLEDTEVMSGEEFLQAVKDAAADFIYKDQLPKADKVYYQLQGYLFPDTYYLEEGIRGEQLVAMMLNEFETQLTEEDKARARELNMSVTELLTRASLVQKETEVMDEFPIIAGVINNRLEKKMKIQFDSTVVYGMTDGKYGVERVMYSDLEDDSPYNTYKIEGLPPGPICNPGKEAIEAVLHPQKHNYLYFQADMEKNDGSNLFFETYEEHMAASSTAHKEETEAAETSTQAQAETGTQAQAETSTQDGE